MMTATSASNSSGAGPLAPFRYAAFAVLWTATVISNTGTWMHDVGAAWLMTELSPSPFIVAAVQAATTLPVFLFALPAGAVADIVDRRKLLIAVNLFMGVTAGLLAFLVAAGMVTPALLLLFTFLLGSGAAFMAPAWQAVVPKLVPKESLGSAIALNSMGINVSRAIGPALAGLLIVSAGLAAPFILNALSVLGIVAALLWWREGKAKTAGLPSEHLLPAMLAGLRYAANSRPLKGTLARAAGFFLFASAYWAMLPLIAREVLSGGPTLYGILMGAVGGGAVLGAFLLPFVKKRLGPDRTVAAGTLLTALMLALLAAVPNQIVAIAASAFGGLAWIAVLSSLNLSAQTALPDWVRARGLSIFLTVFFGCMAGGSLFWGWVAGAYGIPAALLAAAIGAVLGIAATWRFKLNQGAAEDFTPSMHWPEPYLDPESDPGKGPVMIQVTYRIGTADRDPFLQAVRDLGNARRRNGGYGWSIMQDTEDAERFVETWFEASWTDHLRHHERVTASDRALQERILALHTGSEAPSIRHALAAF